MQKNKRSIFSSVKVYFRYYRYTGLYSFILLNFLKVLGIILLILISAIIVNTFVIEIKEIPRFLINTFPFSIVLLFFLVSESILGMIPPDIFIFWVTEYNSFWLLVGLLGLVSYFGGINAYFIGRLIRLAPKLKERTKVYYNNHLKKIKKWGGVFIVIAAIFPIPYAIACSLSGIIKFPFKNLLWLGIFRIARFFLYAIIIFYAL